MQFFNSLKRTSHKACKNKTKALSFKKYIYNLPIHWFTFIWISVTYRLDLIMANYAVVYQLI